MLAKRLEGVELRGLWRTYLDIERKSTLPLRDGVRVH